jgi:hypothetical protein
MLGTLTTVEPGMPGEPKLPRGNVAVAAMKSEPSAGPNVSTGPVGPNPTSSCAMPAPNWSPSL